MKKFTTLLIAMFATLTFTSCDDDIDQAITLSGQWTGNFGMYYGITDRYGRYCEFDASYTDIVFYPDHEYATYGTGQQVDFYREGPYARQYYFFHWQIRNGVIYMSYPHDPQLDTEIYHYTMTDSYFSGRIGNSPTTFRLRKIADYYDWGYYRDDYHYYPSGYYDDYFGGYYYTRSCDDVIKHGNRFKDCR